MLPVSDRLNIAFHGSTPESRSVFATELAQRSNIAFATAMNKLRRWLKHESQPEPDAIEHIIACLKTRFPNIPPEDIESSINDEIGPAEILDIYGVEYEAAKPSLTPHFCEEMARGGVNVSAFTSLTRFATTKGRSSRRRFSLVKGRWTLYRHHSTEPGIIKETMLIESLHRFHAEGTYYQYDPDSGHREIKTSMFFCGDSVTVLGSRTYSNGAKIDPITTSILLRGAYTSTPDPYKNFLHYPGMLLALADGIGVPAAMRVIVRYDSKTATLTSGQTPASRVTDGIDQALYGEALTNMLKGGEYALIHPMLTMTAALNQAIARLNPVK